MVSIQVAPARGKKIPSAKDLPISLQFNGKTADEIKVVDVKNKLAQKYPKLSLARQKLSVGLESGKPLDDDTPLALIGIVDGSTMYVKDLGPQMSWRTVFLIEYLGPLLIHPIFFHFSQAIYGKTVVHSELQRLTHWMVMAHFVKRELETLLVHRFSHGTMPLRNLFKNSAHYWVISGFALAYSLNSPRHSQSAVRGTYKDDPRFLWSCVALFAFAELSNLQAHITLKNLRSPGSKERGIPRGYAFELVSCPNYFFELLAWGAVSLMTNDFIAHVFLLFSGVQMGLWALKKHRRYKKEFGKAYPRRKAMIPFVF